ncbi:MAG: hypothetical protein LBR71_07715 [Synergistaceae bacterium]|jgi:hypothetical protein|nr:hypothetical protein [Synergistaceae bacterium]
MNVTSVLSKGYLEPAYNAGVSGDRRLPEPQSRQEAASLAAQEQQILARERALKMVSGSGAQVSTTYRYTVGPDGRRYITGAEVTVQGDEDAIDRIGGGVKRAVPDALKKGEADEEASKGETPEKTSAARASEGEDTENDAIRELKQIEREVISHEAAHQAAGGRFAGAVSYSYTRGPDGHAYITGGEVPIHVPPSSDPEQTVRDMEQVQRAAMAPASPSGQDRAVAAQAAAAAAQARQQINASRGAGSKGQVTSQAQDTPSGTFKTGISSVRAELLRDRAQSDMASLSGWENDLKGVYARAASPFGLWALGRGFEESTPKEPRSESPFGFPFEIAA